MIVYYDSTSKEITQVSYKKLPNVDHPYVKISSKDEAMLQESGMHIQGFYVDQKRLQRKPDNVRVAIVKPNFDNRYNIPLVNSDNVDFYVRQHIKEKRVEVSLSEQAFMDKEKTLVAVKLIACYNNDPHLPLWMLHIPGNTLSTTPLVYDYRGSDDIRFYTLKIFENYLHEQFS
jgi:hypothetical protein